MNSLFKKLKIKNKKTGFCYFQKFNKKFSKLNYKDFISENILSKKIKCKYIYVSKNFKFGNKREGEY